MNFKLKFLTCILFGNVGVGQKARLRLYLREMGTAVAYAAGADIQSKERANDISILPYFTLSSSENVTFSLWVAFINVMRRW